MINISFQKIEPTEDQVRILYELLKKRKFSISHKVLPTYENHSLFVWDNPYIAWYLVYNFKVLIGSVYLKSDNSIGINLTNIELNIVKEIIKFITDHFIPTEETKSKTPPYFFINVPVQNESLLTTLEELGANKIQITYKVI